MSKVKTITVSNIKAVSSMTADFNGCTGIITGGNNKGKTSFLRSLPDRLRGVKPEMILKQGEHEGFAEWTLTTGERLRWAVDDKTKAGEKLIYISDKDIKSSITRDLANKFFPATFDVDRFLQDQPAKQRKTLQELVGLDFTSIDQRYKDAFEDRQNKNRAANEAKIRFEAIVAPVKTDIVDVAMLLAEKETIRTELNNKYTENKNTNELKRKEWLNECDKLRDEVELHNSEVGKAELNYTICNDAASVLISHGFSDKSIHEFLSGLRSFIADRKTYFAPAEPSYIPELPDNTPLLTIDEKINTANETNRKAQLYANWLTSKQSHTDAVQLANDADTLVNTINTERMDLIKSAKMPEGFGFSDDGITYNDLPFTREQLSSSGIYIAALKLAAMTLGEVRTLHFDASFLDRQSLEAIEQWSVTMDLQLLVERPSWEPDEITYELITPTPNP